MPITWGPENHYKILLYLIKRTETKNIDIENLATLFEGATPKALREQIKKLRREAKLIDDGPENTIAPDDNNPTAVTPSIDSSPAKPSTGKPRGRPKKNANENGSPVKDGNGKGGKSGGKAGGKRKRGAGGGGGLSDKLVGGEVEEGYGGDVEEEVGVKGEGDGEGDGEGGKVLVEVQGRHQEVVEGGVGIPKCVGRCVELLVGLEQGLVGKGGGQGL